MNKIILSSLSLFLVGFFIFSGSVWCGEVQTITLGGKPLTLTGEKLQTGKMLPTVLLPDLGMNMVDLQSFKGKVTLLSVVPSLDTPTCDKQTHILSEENKGPGKIANLITISRDLPFAQKRFASKTKMKNIIFLSDYRDAEFGKSTGLLIEENRLLARAIIILDSEGIVRYLEIVAELSELPDMEKAMAFARSL
ncbi:MAG: thiol peroxidase [Nitrospinaceae bacterium]|nr:thiol peroxidase [Nitrospinaceae bacterium]